MILHKDDFPITIQAFEITGDKEFFIAEQVVNNQTEVDTFSNRYAGKVIKVKTTTATATASERRYRRSNSGVTVLIVILIILIILVAIGFYTGWIQRTTGIHL